MSLPSCLWLRYPLGVVPAPISDIGPLGPVRVCGELLGAGLLPPPPLPLLAAALPPPPLLVLEETLAAGVGELSAWLVSRGV